MSSSRRRAASERASSSPRSCRGRDRPFRHLLLPQPQQPSGRTRTDDPIPRSCASLEPGAVRYVKRLRLGSLRVALPRSAQAVCGPTATLSAVFRLRVIDLALLALTAAGCGGGSPSAPPSTITSTAAKTRCPRAWRIGWQKVANEIKAPVFCPTWMPEPLDAKFGGRWFNGRFVDPDRSYLVSFA